MVEQFGVVAARAKAFDQAPRLPIRAVIDALVKGENADVMCSSHASEMPPPGRGSAPLTQIRIARAAGSAAAPAATKAIAAGTGSPIASANTVATTSTYPCFEIKLKN